jgi:sulfonate transport system substrate-binding protein
MSNFLPNLQAFWSVLTKQADRLLTLGLQPFKRSGWQQVFVLFAVGFSLSVAIASCSSPAEPESSPSATVSPVAQTQVLRVGYQKSAAALNLLKSKGTLEKTLQPQGVSVEWSEFAAGPQMLEALNVGSIDFAYTGETPPVFAQAADAPLAYVAYEPLGPSAEAILVRQDSPIKSVAELKGRKVALNKGSNVHYLLVRALEEAGLQYSDIQPVFLPPGDARPVFEQGSVDAWVIWDPFLAAAEKSVGARILRDGKGLVANRGFFLSTRSFVTDKPDLLKALLDQLSEISDWAKSNPVDVAKFLSAELKIDQAALELTEGRRGYGVRSLTDEVIAGQQQIADTFFKLGLIPKEIKVSEAVWNPS